MWERACSRWRWFSHMDVGLLASSRASSLPQRNSGCTRILCRLKIQCGSELARDGSGSVTWMLGQLAGSLPQEKRGPTKNQVGYQAASRWTLISAPH